MINCLLNVEVSVTSTFFRMNSETHHVQNLHPSMLTSSIFSITILAYWDNVMGPMVKKIWKGNDHVKSTDEIINYVSNHTLSGELCRQTERHTIDPKLCILPDLGYIFNAFIFNGNSKLGSTITSISFVMPYNELDRFLLLQDFIEKQVKCIILRYRIFQQKVCLLFICIQLYINYRTCF